MSIDFPVPIGDKKRLVIIGGINVLESIDLAIEVGNEFKEVCKSLGLEYIFKASFDKANRSSVKSFRGPGLEKGLKMLKAIKEALDVPILTDVHETNQVGAASETCDILQLPAFLARQTDLIKSLALSGRPIHIKKPQYLSPSDMAPIVEKFSTFGCENIVLCERGSLFGYNNQIVDIFGLKTMREISKDKPISVDITHSLQYRSEGQKSSNGRRSQALILAKAVVATGIDALFIESHTNPSKALCDGPSAIPCSQIAPFLEQISEIDKLIKSQNFINSR